RQLLPFFPVGDHEAVARVAEDARHGRRHREREEVGEVALPPLGQELGRREGQVRALARREEAAEERHPERDLLDVPGPARDVEAAERAADRVDQREERREEESPDEERLLRPLEETDQGDSYFFLARNSARCLF